MIDCVVLLVTSNVSNSKLKYWLDYGELLSAGEMKGSIWFIFISFTCNL